MRSISIVSVVMLMAIVFVVWVGVGPFAGAIALSLHTTAALAKLYSEQVESIMEGPIEAVAATGATKLQNIVYAVVPQIVPPYIAFDATISSPALQRQSTVAEIAAMPLAVQ